MNADTGRIYDLSELGIGEGGYRDPVMSAGQLDALAQLKMERGEALTQDELAACVDAARGDTIVAVSDQVAHTMRTGQREVDRRKRRRKAQRDGRKRNR